MFRARACAGPATAAACSHCASAHHFITSTTPQDARLRRPLHGGGLQPQRERAPRLRLASLARPGCTAQAEAVLRELPVGHAEAARRRGALRRLQVRGGFLPKKAAQLYIDITTISRWHRYAFVGCINHSVILVNIDRISTCHGWTKWRLNAGKLPAHGLDSGRYPLALRSM